MELISANDIEKVSFDILRQSKALDVFPTPVNKIVSYAELIVRNDIDVSKIHAGYVSKVTTGLRSALKKIRGMLDRSEKTIYLDLSQRMERQNFVKLHEVGHDVLPWQKVVHALLDDDDESLSTETKDEFEAEAIFLLLLLYFSMIALRTKLRSWGWVLTLPYSLQSILAHPFMPLYADMLNIQKTSVL